ncbi:TIGR01244 family sulfur transferase [Tabrizicola oligotrophica]|uniref:TIGR01244 family phosphatase n=1 Tax=Tabrizicola oligotrophica TaxID=2710650 RepID=A0A6M0QRM2_9RHOB|nr:TIGR01244 family sulfur transferase [Tabrizicola oligotrophica]NEY89082.1 TIGR01244 family phosphatase [Tabrizicola oligotrophica]
MTLDLRRLTPDYGVAPQIGPEDLAAVKAAGFVMVIDNRPDGEIAPDLQSDAMAVAARAAGLEFVINPVTPGQFTPDLVARQRAAIAAAGGPVLAYCASGNRSTILWELVHAGRLSVDDMLQTAAQAGYSHEQLRPLIEAFAKT